MSQSRRSQRRLSHVLSHLTPIECTTTLPRFRMSEIAKHNTANDCWLVLYNKVYDVTNFLSKHPGGIQIVVKYAGTDATTIFEAVGHSKGLLTTMLDEAKNLVGILAEDEQTSTDQSQRAEEAKMAEFREKQKQLPPLDSIINFYDFERGARDMMTAEGWAYYSSGADDEVTLRENERAFARIWLRPRILIDVSKIDTRTKMLGTPCELPIYLTATALGKLAHPKGECLLTKAAHNKGVIQMIPTLASCSFDEICDARVGGAAQPTWFQLYVNQDRDLTLKLIKRAEQRGVRAVFVTVDAPTFGRREKDMRFRFTNEHQANVQGEVTEEKTNKGIAGAIGTFIDSSLNWKDVAWIKKNTTMKVGLKGIQSGQDAILAVQAGVDAIVVSNHGGRQLDYVPSGIEMLVEVMNALDSINARNRLEVFVDGGFRRGADIFKALALGARGVGLGRPMLYSMACYGQAGAEKMIDLLREELEMTMRLMGTPRVSDVNKSCLISRDLATHAAPPATRSLADQVYVPMRTAHDQ